MPRTRPGHATARQATHFEARSLPATNRSSLSGISENQHPVRSKYVKCGFQHMRALLGTLQHPNWLQCSKIRPSPTTNEIEGSRTTRLKWGIRMPRQRGSQKECLALESRVACCRSILPDPKIGTQACELSGMYTQVG